MRSLSRIAFQAAAAWAFIVLVALPPAAKADDFSLGGKIALFYDYDIGNRLLGYTVDETLRCSFSPLVSYSGSAGAWAWEFRAEARAGAVAPPSEGSVELESASARLWAGEYFLAEAAYGTDSSVAAEAFPLTTFLGPADPLARLEDWNVSQRRSEPYVRIGAAKGALRSSILCAPFAPLLVLPDLDSPFFPEGAIPATIEIDGFGLAWKRDSISYVAGEQYADDDLVGRASWRIDPDWTVKAGATLGPFDIDLTWFHGLERRASLYPRILFPTGLGGEEYSVELEPRRARIDAVALSATFVSGVFRTWLESSFTWNASLETGNAWYGDLAGSIYGEYFDPDGHPLFSFVPPVVQRSRAAATWGASLAPDWSRLSAIFLLEATWSSYVDAPEGSWVPALSRAAAASITLGDPAQRFSLTLVAVASFADGSLALRPSTDFYLWDELGFELAVPLFLGGTDTELGQYAGRHHVTFSLVYRF